MSAAIGQPLDRIDGRAKVTGAARYSAEIALPHVTYAVLLGARIASGRVSSLDTSEAERSAGVIAVLTHRNLSKIGSQPKLLPSLFGHAAPGETFFPMQDDVVHYAGQPVAMVVADSLDRAQYAATLVRVSYDESSSTTILDQGRDKAYVPEKIFGGLLPGRMTHGDVEAGLAAADVRIDRRYRYWANHHNPIETSATTAIWEDGLVTLYDATQGVVATKLTVAALLGVPPAKVRVLSHYVGGSFGAKAMVWPHSTLAAMAARHVGRPVKLSLTREQMFTACGHREEQEQHVVLGATKEGRLTAYRHHKISLTSPFDDWAEPSLGISSQLYACSNYEGIYHLVHGNTMTPTFTRGPGESTGIFSLECAMDELAYELGIDPLELRLRNHADVDPLTGNAWSSKGLKECYQLGADRFGWKSRKMEPRSQREGNWLIGTGMATAAYPVPLFPGLQPQRARAHIFGDGSAVVECATQEFGTGGTTAMTQVAADGLGLPVEQIRFEYGDSDFPSTAAAVGSAGAAMVSAAVHSATTALRNQMIAWAVADEKSPLFGVDRSKVIVRDGRMMFADLPDSAETYGDLLRRRHVEDAEALGSWDPPGPLAGKSAGTFGAQFAEVAVDADLGVVRVRRMLGVVAPGRILNAKTAHSQLMGGMLWGLSQALLEGTYMDSRLGRWANTSLGDYLVPVNADAPDVETHLVEIHDEDVNPLGVKGVGEICMVGAGAAIANAVFHATGRRVRELPIRIENLIMNKQASTDASA